MYIEEIERIMPKGIGDEMQGRKVLSFSLFGRKAKYIRGAHKNLAQQPVRFPGWVCRFYVSTDVPVRDIDDLRDNGAEIIIMRPESGTVGSMWRFLAHDEEDVCACLFLDVDTFLRKWQLCVAKEWLSSDKHYCIMRGSSAHNSMAAGRWGVKGGSSVAVNMRQEIEKFLACQKVKNLGYGIGETFLNRVIYPRIFHHTLIYSESTLFPGETVHAFPRPASGSWPTTEIPSHSWRFLTEKPKIVLSSDQGRVERYRQYWKSAMHVSGDGLFIMVTCLKEFQFIFFFCHLCAVIRRLPRKFKKRRYV